MKSLLIQTAKRSGIVDAVMLEEFFKNVNGDRRRIDDILLTAPDFTEDLMQERLSLEQDQQLEAEGFAEIPNCYDEEPYKITKALIDDGRNHLLLRGEIPLDCPVRLIHGTNDEDVPWQTSLTTQYKLRSTDVETLFVKNGDHRLSEPHDLARLCKTVDRLLDQLQQGA